MDEINFYRMGKVAECMAGHGWIEFAGAHLLEQVIERQMEKSILSMSNTDRDHVQAWPNEDGTPKIRPGDTQTVCVV